MKKLFVGILFFIVQSTYSQKITNVVFIGANGVTEDPNKATSFIVVKQYPDNHFERFDYKKGGPMSMLRSYRDTGLKILEGRYFEYTSEGTIKTSGHYLNNQKTSDWRTFNDNGKVILTIKYDHDSILSVDDMTSSVNNVASKASIISYPDEREASFPGGDKAWKEYLIESLEKSQTAEKALTGGEVIINFKIGIDGNIQDIYVSKSVEYIIDEESIKIIANSPKWDPAFQNGKFLNAYRRQPLTFTKQ